MPLQDMIRFPAMGDWGGTEYLNYYVPTQEWNAGLMDDLCANDTCDMLVSLGDNFYETGVKNIEDPRWKIVFENVYGRWSHRENLKKLDFWQILGNHDHRGNQTAQVDYMYQVPTSNFKMPYYYHTIEIEKSSDLSMKLIMIDTMIMNKSSEINKLPDADIRDYFQEQLDWLEHELETCFATYCIVAGHHPMYSIGVHGPTSKLLKYLEPLLLKHKVDAYVSGHDHNLQHFFHQDVHYVVSGMGEIANLKRNHLNDERNPPYEFFSLMKDEHLGLTLFEMTDEKLEISFISGKKNTHHRVVVRKKTPV